jgi:FlaG/FlaF family flagellin (archaellin)
MVAQMLAVSCVVAVILIFAISYDLQRHKAR